MLPMPVVDYSANFLILLPAEVVIGLGIGYVSMLIFNAIQMAGQLIDVPMGFSMVNVFNPSTDTQLPVMGDFYYVLAMLLFLATNAHHLLIGAMVESYHLLGLGQPIRYDLLAGFSETFMRIFVIAVKIAIPAVGVMLMSDVAIALLTRTVSSINAFILGVPIKIALGVTTMLLSIAAYTAFAGNLLHSSESGIIREILNWVGLLGGP
jgi:flagellar biosynthetic protein FliR